MSIIGWILFGCFLALIGLFACAQIQLDFSNRGKFTTNGGIEK